jgi:hypothetical protein
MARVVKFNIFEEHFFLNSVIAAILDILFRIKIMYFVFKLLIFLRKSILFQLNVLFLHLLLTFIYFLVKVPTAKN